MIQNWNGLQAQEYNTGFMSIRVKLFLAFLLNIVIVVMGMHCFTRWSLEIGFTEFVEIKHHERLDKSIDVLEEHDTQYRG